MQHRISFSILLSFLIAGCIQGESAKPSPTFVSTIAEVKNSIAAVACFNPSEKSGVASIGTAFFISKDGTFVTADHILDDAVKEKPVCPPFLYLPKLGWHTAPSKFDVELFQVRWPECTRRREYDVAVCKVTNLDFKRLSYQPAALSFESEIQPEGTPVAFSGFPLSMKTPLTSVATISGYGPTTVFLDSLAWPGSSGGPIYLVNGKVVGIISGTAKHDNLESGGRAGGRPTPLIQEVLNEHYKKFPPAK